MCSSIRKWYRICQHKHWCWQFSQRWLSIHPMKTRLEFCINIWPKDPWCFRVYSQLCKWNWWLAFLHASINDCIYWLFKATRYWIKKSTTFSRYQTIKPSWRQSKVLSKICWPRKIRHSSNCIFYKAVDLVVYGDLLAHSLKQAYVSYFAGKTKLVWNRRVKWILFGFLFQYNLMGESSELFVNCLEAMVETCLPIEDSTGTHVIPRTHNLSCSLSSLTLNSPTDKGNFRLAISPSMQTN